MSDNTPTDARLCRSDAPRQSQDPSPRPRTPRADRRRGAWRSSPRRGYEAASIGRIAAAAGVCANGALRPLPLQARAVRRAAPHRSTRLCSATMSAALAIPGTDCGTVAGDVRRLLLVRRGTAARLATSVPGPPAGRPEAATEHRRAAPSPHRMLAELLATDARRAGLDPTTRPGSGGASRSTSQRWRAPLRWWQAHPKVTRDQLRRRGDGGAVDRLRRPPASRVNRPA